MQRLRTSEKESIPEENIIYVAGVTIRVRVPSGSCEVDVLMNVNVVMRP